jgi:dethiobiotin synthetase
MEHREVNDAMLTEAAQSWKNHADYLVVEGAGGIFCPLSDSSTVMELALALQPAIVVVAANRLGVINHTRLTVESIQSKGLNVIAVVLNEITPSPNASSDGNDEARPNDASLPSNAEQLQHWIPELPFFHCSWCSEHLTRIPRTAESALTANPEDSEASLVRLILEDQRGG